jgi:hypothetical protein
MIRRIDTPSRVISAVGGRHLAFVAVVTKEILIFSLRRAQTWVLLQKRETTHPVTAMDIISDRVLSYGLGDEGYGVIKFSVDEAGKDVFTKFEAIVGTEKNKKSAAKVTLMSNFKENGFVWKTGGYTTATEDKRKVPCWLCSFTINEAGVKAVSRLNKNAHILGEVEEDTYLIYLL